MTLLQSTDFEDLISNFNKMMTKTYESKKYFKELYDIVLYDCGKDVVDEVVNCEPHLKKIEALEIFIELKYDMETFKTMREL